jgi:hypothetical protein
LISSGTREVDRVGVAAIARGNDVQIAKRDLGKSLDRIETVNKPKAA